MQARGDLQVLGIVQEQHPDRARLFMQWKQMEWPVLVDSYNLLEVPYVPITLSIDEFGIIREIHPPLEEPENIERTLLAGQHERPATLPRTGGVPNLDNLRDATATGTADSWRAYGDALAVWGGVDEIDYAIGAYQQALRIDPQHGLTHFRMGVAHRMRYDSGKRQDGDFQRAVDHWTTALEIDPNQYIWRRRIQQYGPRLDKPYPFYDWVITARDEITARGESPAPLKIEPGGAEFAQPTRTFATSQIEEPEPDPRGRVLRDNGQFITVETIAVPATIDPGDAARFHILFTPIEQLDAHWNNEAEDLALWIEPPQGWTAENRYLSIPVPAEPVTEELRTLEVEVRAPENIKTGTVSIPAYALYYVCEGVTGVCMYRRQDIPLTVTVR